MTRVKYTYDDVKKEFEEKDYKLLSTKYVNCNTKMKYICNKHRDKGIQEITFSKLHHSGQGCYYCGRERTEEARKTPLNLEEDKCLCISKNFTYISSYKENNIYYINFICNSHEELGVQRMRKSNMKRDIKGCQYCSGKNFPEWYVMKKKDEVNPHIELLEPYKNMTTRMNCRCIIHNCNTRKSMQDILKGQGCYYCGLKKLSENNLLTDEQVNKNIHKKNPHVDLIQYNGADVMSIWNCRKHNLNFKKCYTTLLYCNSGCEECYKENLRERDGMGQEEFEKRLHEVHPQLSAKSNYINNSTYMDFYCNDHNCSFSTTPANILTKLSCCPKSRITYKEETVCDLLESWDYKITRQKTFEGCKDKKPLKFDCYLDDYNVCIEYDGEQHFRPVRFGEESDEETLLKFEYTQKHDKIKNDFCRENNIGLIRIPYYKFDDLEFFLFEKLREYNIISEVKIS